MPVDLTGAVVPGGRVTEVVEPPAVVESATAVVPGDVVDAGGVESADTVVVVGGLVVGPLAPTVI